MSLTLVKEQRFIRIILLLLVTGSCHSLFFPSLGLPICFSGYIVHLRCTSWGGGVVSMFNETSHSVFVWGSSWASVALPCCCHCYMGCIVYTDHVYSACVPLLADITCLLFLFRKCCCLFFSLFPFFFTMQPFFFPSLVYWPFRTRLLACPVFLLSSAFVYIPTLCHR